MTTESHPGLRERAAAALTAARARTAALTDPVTDQDLTAQHSPLMSPLVWDLAHIGNQEELWLLGRVAGRESLHPEINPLYDAFEHPRSERPKLPLLGPRRPAGTRPRCAAGSSTCWSAPRWRAARCSTTVSPSG